MKTHLCSFLISLIVLSGLVVNADCETLKSRKIDPVIQITDKTKKSGKEIEDFFDLMINGCQQRVLIHSKNIEKNPILLYLHGGPGSSLMMYAYLYEQKLTEHYIFVNWDMRGTALSYHEGMDPQKISQGQIVEDTLALINYLKQRFNKKKIFLIGHSFGSALGLYLVDKYPDLFYAYIGIGQVINYQKSVKMTYNWLRQKLIEQNDTKGQQKVEKDRFPHMDLVTKYGGHHNLDIDLSNLIKGSPYYFDGYLELLQKGKRFSAANVSKNPKTFGSNFEYIKKSTVPLYFFEGRHDHVIACAPDLVVDFCKTIEAPIKKVVWFENSAHYLPVEEPLKFQEELVNIAQATFYNR